MAARRRPWSHGRMSAGEGSCFGPGSAQRPTPRLPFFPLHPSRRQRRVGSAKTPCLISLTAQQQAGRPGSRMALGSTENTAKGRVMGEEGADEGRLWIASGAKRKMQREKGVMHQHHRFIPAANHRRRISLVYAKHHVRHALLLIEGVQNTGSERRRPSLSPSWQADAPFLLPSLSPTVVSH